MKKILCTAVLLVSLLAGTAVYAAPGDVKQPYYTTDILTYMDGIPIQGYSLNGRMMIELESLESYGFSVSYDDTVRALFVNKTNDPYEDFSPVYERNPEGNIAGYTYETDIAAYVNGKSIPVESINGKLLAIAEDLARVVYDRESDLYKEYGQFGVSEYFMMHSWDADNRRLDISNTTGTMMTYKERVEELKSRCEQSGLQLLQETEYGTVLVGSGEVYFVWKDGKYALLNGIFERYGLAFEGNTEVKEPSISDDGMYLEFHGAKSRYIYPMGHSRETYDEGRYAFDLKNFVIKFLG